MKWSISHIKNIRNCLKKEKPNLQPDCSVSGALGAFLRLARFTGISPLRFAKRGNEWRISVSPGLSIFGYFMATAIFLSLIGNLVVLDKDRYTDTKKNFVVCIAEVIVTMAITGKMVYGAPGQMRSIISHLNQLQRINSDLNIQPMPLEKKTAVLFVFWALATLAFSSAEQVLYIVNQINGNEFEECISLMLFSYYWCNWIIQLCQVRFIMITKQVLYSFKAVNDGLRTTLQDGTTNSPHYSKVHRLALAYTTLCNLMREVDRCHGLELVMILVFLIMNLISAPYFFITDLLMGNNASQTFATHWINLALQLFWCLLYTFSLVMTVEPCHLTHLEMLKTRQLVSHLMRYTYSAEEPLAMELELFFKHIVLNEVSYKPLKVTTMSRSFVIKILGSITTYLIIIIQL